MWFVGIDYWNKSIPYLACVVIVSFHLALLFRHVVEEGIRGCLTTSRRHNIRPLGNIGRHLIWWLVSKFRSGLPAPFLLLTFVESSYKSKLTSDLSMLLTRTRAAQEGHTTLQLSLGYPKGKGHKCADLAVTQVISSNRMYDAAHPVCHCCPNMTLWGSGGVIKCLVSHWMAVRSQRLGWLSPSNYILARKAHHSSKLLLSKCWYTME